MKNKNISITMNNRELKHIAEKILKNKNVSINTINITDNIEITGFIPLKLLDFPFTCKLSLLPISTGNITIKILSFAASNISLPLKIQNLAFKTIIKTAKSHCSYDNNSLTINLREKLDKYGLENTTISDILVKNNNLIILGSSNILFDKGSFQQQLLNIVV